MCCDEDLRNRQGRYSLQTSRSHRNSPARHTSHSRHHNQTIYTRQKQDGVDQRPSCLCPSEVRTGWRESRTKAYRYNFTDHRTNDAVTAYTKSPVIFGIRSPRVKRSLLVRSSASRTADIVTARSNNTPREIPKPRSKCSHVTQETAVSSADATTELSANTPEALFKRVCLTRTRRTSLPAVQSFRTVFSAMHSQCDRS